MPRCAILSFMLTDRITFDPQQYGGRPCVRRLRIRVKDVLDMLAVGATSEGILDSYPDLEPDDIRACLAYAAQQIDHPILTPAE